MWVTQMLETRSNSQRLTSNEQEVQERKDLLGRMQAIVNGRRNLILDSLHDDLRKPAREAIATEISPVLAELQFALENLDDWAQKSTLRPAGRTHGSYFAFPQPLGKALVISAWNYPFQLALLPIINALAAGNKVVLKPSEIAPSTAKVIKEISKQLDSNLSLIHI